MAVTVSGEEDPKADSNTKFKTQKDLFPAKGTTKNTKGKKKKKRNQESKT